MPVHDTDAEERGFNLPPRSRIWRDGVLPRLVLPLFWIAWALLLPSFLIGLPRRRANRRRVQTLAIESGRIGWTQVFFEELIATAADYLGPERVHRQVIDRDRPYLPQFRANLDRDRPTHAVLDVRTPGQSWRLSLGQALAVTWSLNLRGIVPIVVMTDAFFRRQRWHSATLTAFRGVVVTFASAQIVQRIFPHHRLIGPMVMPVSQRRLDDLEERARQRTAATGRRVCFIGNVYSPRKEFLEAVGQRLAAGGIELTVIGGKTTSNEDYWQTLVDADVVVTTTLQGPDRSFMDWLWVQQAVFRFIEATAAGAALVASEVPGIERFFRPEHDFLEFVSVDQAVSAIQRLIDDEGLRSRISTQGHVTATGLIRSHAFWTIIDADLGADAFTA